MKNSTLFKDIPLGAPDPILGLTEQFLLDPNPKKANLGVGVYQNAEGKAVKLSAIRKAEAKLLETDIAAGYSPIDGTADFARITQEVVFGSNSEPIRSKRVCTIQTPGGTGALSLGAKFISTFFGARDVLISNPTWDNHTAIFQAAGLPIQQYEYYDSQARYIKVEACLEAFSRAKDGSVALLHVCCHNPTGSDFAPEQWNEILQLCERKNMIPFLDFAYQGFKDGLAEDAATVRMFAERGLPALVASSFSKNFGLYSERIGALSIVTSSEDEAARVRSQIKRIIRTIYSNPPTHGSKIVQTVLTDPTLTEEWNTELSSMRERMKSMRQKLVVKLKDHGVPMDFSHVLNQHGMFSYSGLSKDVVLWIRKHRSIYAADSGRICVAALNDHNIDYVCEGIAEAVKAVGGV